LINHKENKGERRSRSPLFYFEVTTSMNKRLSQWQLWISGLAIALAIILQFPTPAPADPACTHGMRIVGETSIYLSHMGLFDEACHTYQAIFEVSFEGPNNPQERYLTAQKQDPNQNEFTLEPTQKFVLTDFAEGVSFKANIHRGQYERSATNPQQLDQDVTVKVKRVLHLRRFDAMAKQPPTSQYLLFGTNTEQLAAHLITAPPDFDQIVAVKTPIPLPQTALTEAIRLVLPNRPTLTPSANFSYAVKPGEKPTVRINGELPNRTIEIGSQYFWEVDDYK
jgi:hypothetical protein